MIQTFLFSFYKPDHSVCQNKWLNENQLVSLALTFFILKNAFVSYSKKMADF